jgi:hypothetical protein
MPPEQGPQLREVRCLYIRPSNGVRFPAGTAAENRLTGVEIAHKYIFVVVAYLGDIGGSGRRGLRCQSVAPSLLRYTQACKHGR